MHALAGATRRSGSRPKLLRGIGTPRDAVCATHGQRPYYYVRGAGGSGWGEGASQATKAVQACDIHAVQAPRKPLVERNRAVLGLLAPRNTQAVQELLRGDVAALRERGWPVARSRRS